MGGRAISQTKQSDFLDGRNCENCENYFPNVIFERKRKSDGLSSRFPDFVLAKFYEDHESMFPKLAKLEFQNDIFRA